MPLSPGMAHLVDDNRTGKYQNRILGAFNVHSIAVTKAEPTLRDCCHRPIASTKHVLVIEKITLRFQVVRARNADGETVMKRREQMLPDNCSSLAAAHDLVGLSPREYALLDKRELVSVQILK